MTWCFHRPRLALLLGGLAALSAAPVRGQGPLPTPTVAPAPPAATYGAIAWSELTYSTHKFFLSASTTIEVERAPAGVVAETFPAVAGDRPVPIPEGGAATITVETALPFGRDETVRLFFDGSTGTALGGEKTTLGKSAYHKLFRYTEGGLVTWRSAPANEREVTLPPASWTQRKWSLVEPTTAPPQGAPVADSYALIYLVSAAHLNRPGDSRRIFMLADDRFVEVTFVAGGLTYHRVDCDEVWPGGRRRRQGDVLVREVKVAARALASRESREDVDLGFLGMRGSLTVYLEVGTDLPVVLSGRVEHIGQVTVRLDRAALTSAPPTLDH